MYGNIVQAEADKIISKHIYFHAVRYSFNVWTDSYWKIQQSVLISHNWPNTQLEQATLND